MRTKPINGAIYRIGNYQEVVFDDGYCIGGLLWDRVATEKVGNHSVMRTLGIFTK